MCQSFVFHHGKVFMTEDVAISGFLVAWQAVYSVFIQTNCIRVKKEKLVRESVSKVEMMGN